MVGKEGEGLTSKLKQVDDFGKTLVVMMFIYKSAFLVLLVAIYKNGFRKSYLLESNDLKMNM